MIVEESFHNIEDFQRVCFTRKDTFILSFYSEWCGPCKIQKEEFEELSEKYPLTKIFLLNVDTHMFLCDCFQIRGIPYHIVMKDQKVIQSFQGLQNKEVFEKLLD